MSRNVVLGILALIILLNAFVIGYVLIDRTRDDGDGDTQVEQTDETEATDETTEETATETEGSEEETSDTETIDETTGSVPEDGNYTENEKELNASAIEKSEANRNLMLELGKWIATNYAPDDIKTTEYTVHRGDTLWEISEAYYGTGSDWRKILELNKDEVGYLPNGSQALIIPGQVLVLE